MELRFSDGEFIYNQAMNAVANALAHKELIPDVNLNEKEERDVKRFEEKKAPRPEPFETKRRMFWSIRESALVKKVRQL